MSDGNTTSRRRRNWWKRNRWNALFSVLGAIASGYIGYLIGFHIDVSKNMYDCIVKIGTSIDNFNTNMAKMDTAINVYHDEVHSVIKNFIINPDTGIKCKVGVNNTNDIYFVTVSKLHNPHMLNDGDKLLFISENKSTRSRYCVEAYVQLVNEGSHSDAEFFLNTRMFQILGINKPQGVYSLSFERIPRISS